MYRFLAAALGLVACVNISVEATIEEDHTSNRDLSGVVRPDLATPDLTPSVDMTLPHLELEFKLRYDFEFYSWAAINKRALEQSCVEVYDLKIAASTAPVCINKLKAARQKDIQDRDNAIEALRISGLTRPMIADYESKLPGDPTAWPLLESIKKNIEDVVRLGTGVGAEDPKVDC